MVRIQHLSLLLLTAVSACSPTPCIEPLDPAGSHYGRSYGEWGAAWWEWSYSFVGCGNDAVADRTGEICGYGQSGDVWFLAGTYIGEDPVERTCTIPAGRAIFFPIINTTADNGGVPPEEHLTAEEARETAARFYEITRPVEVVVDGCSIGGLERYRGGPTEYTYVISSDPQNSYRCSGIDFEGTVEHAQSAGYWMMLPPLSPGPHELRFRGTVGADTVETEDDQAVDATYHLMIE